MSDAVVVGGGVIGCMTAWRLAQRGWSVTLLDADAPPAGATAATHSNLSIYNRTPGVELELALRTVDTYRQLEHEGYTEIGYCEVGGALLIGNQDDLPAAQRWVTQQREAGVRCELVDSDTLRLLDPTIGARAVAAIISPQSAVVYAPGVCYALLRAAERNGVRVKPFSRIIDAQLSSHGWRLRTNNGNLEAEHVVVAAGVDAGSVAKAFGITLTITPVRGHIAITTRQRRVGIAMKGEFVNLERHESAHTGVRLVWTHTPEGHIFIGRSSELGVADRTVDPAVVAAIASRVRYWLPEASQLPIQRIYTGIRPQGPGGRPVVGPVPNRPGVWLAAGFGDKGIGLAFAARLLADRMAGDVVPLLDSYAMMPQATSRPEP